MAKFWPQGKTVLNRTEWQGKQRRSCGVTKVSMRPHTIGSNDPILIDVEVTYRPKGCITYSGSTKYDGWTAMVRDQARDGTLLDGHGNPLPEGQPPVFLAYEVYDDIEFNELDFGEFVGEYDDDGIKHVRFEEVRKAIESSPRFSVSMKSTFMAMRRHRPSVKIVISKSASGYEIDGFGTKVINVNSYTPHLQQVLLDQFTDLMFGYIEGRYSVKTMSNDELVFVDLGGVLVDASEDESRFDCLDDYMPSTFLDDLAQRISATYEVEVSVVTGEVKGLLLKHST